MKIDKLKEVLESHKKWLNCEGGEKADLSGAKLRWANFRRADLRGADLSGADLHGADLRWAVLSGAVLSGADLRGADLRGAELSGARFLEIHTDIWTVQVHAEHARIGFQYHTHDEWMSFRDDEIDTMDRRALAWWKIYKPIVAGMIAAVNAQEVKG